MNENLTEIVCIIDRSTSILSNGMVSTTIEGFNAFLLEQKLQPGEAKMTLVLFDGDRNNPVNAYEIRNDGDPLDLVEALSTENFTPKGMTALWDAIGRTIDTIKTRQSETPNDERPSKTIVLIMTDGEENSSVEYKKPIVQKMITDMEDNHNWAFIFLGAGIDAMSVGSELGVKMSNTWSYQQSSVATQDTFNKMNNLVNTTRKMSSVDYKSFKDTLMSDLVKNEENDK